MQLAITQLAAGGGVLAICPMPGRHGAYLEDLRAIFAFGPAVVVTMTTRDELEDRGVGGLGADLAAADIGWCHLPIVDFGEPDAAVQAEWPEVSAGLRQVLADGGRVLLHCMGGCGRSGMAALRLMIETGEAPESALARLRALRPCAVETAGQMNWAMAGRKGP